jgi:hypothetical protein
MKDLKWKIILAVTALLGLALYLMSPTELTISVEKPSSTPMTAPRWST